MIPHGAPQPGRWWTIANGVRIDERDRERLAQLIYEAVVEEREACAKAAETIGWSSPTSETEFALREAAKIIAAKIRNRTGRQDSPPSTTVIGDTR
jgi:predicted unusual protein kinase regulating ubiquinone biosynthesis (AarF/ABC1/UbiB family)